MLRIKLVKSPIGNTASNRATVKALGLRKMQQVVEKEDTPSIRGMIHKVKHMLLVEEVDSAAPAPASKTKRKREEKPADEASPELVEAKE